MTALGLVVVAVAILALAVITGGAISVLRIPRGGAVPKQPASVPARVLCPILGEVTRVRLGKMPRDGRLGVVWCERFGDAEPRCDRSCFGAAIAGSLA
jgi:hypothetical protein